MACASSCRHRGDARRASAAYSALVGVADLRHAGCAGRDQHEGVVGRGVAVHRDAVERAVRGLRDQSLRAAAALTRGIGGDEAEHGRHVGMDHAGALGDAGDGDRLRRRCSTRRDAALGTVSVVMIACAARRTSCPRGQSARHAGRPATMRSTGSGSMITPVENGSTCADAQPSSCAQLGAGLARRGKPFLAGAGVGVAGVDHQRADRRVRIDRRQMLPRHHHRRGAEAVLREHAGDARAGVELHHQQVLARGLADTRLGDAQRSRP